MNSHEAKIRAAIEATRIDSPISFAWFGAASEHLPRAVRRSLTHETARTYLHYVLQTKLYNCFYCTGEAQPAAMSQAAQAPSAPTPFVEALGEANSGRGQWSAGWTIAQLGTGGTALVHRDGIRVLARPGEIEAAGPGEAIAPGATTRLRFPKEYRHLSPGFYMVVGEHELVQDARSPILRYYWNLTAGGAIRFVHEFTRELNGAGLAFKLKVLSDPARYSRCDAGVLYIRKTDHARVAEIVERIHAELAPALKPSTPALTRPLAHGLALADDPGGGASFGLHRCGLLADGLIRAFEAGEDGIVERMGYIEQAFSDAGVNLDRPYLNAGADDIYRPLTRKRQASAQAPMSAARAIGTDQFVETAGKLGRALVERAIWHGDRCTWLGAEPVAEDANPAGARVVHATLGPDLYSGAAGLALFLAQLSAATGDERARETAIGALAQAFVIAERVPPAARYGFFSGWSGIAYAGVRVGALVRAEEWTDKGLALLARLDREPPEHPEPDILAGTAGAIVALLALRRERGATDLLEMAVRLGDGLAGSAEWAEDGCCWTSPGHPDNPGLAGFSHGASGIGRALFGLHAATGEERYRELAEGAFAYERALFDEATGNWPDLRTFGRRKKRGGQPRTFSTAWCHGAPGIALARLRALLVSKDGRTRDEALAALATTARSVEAGLASEAENYSLCHGMAGNAEVLVQGLRMLDEPRTGDAELARQVAVMGVERYAGKDEAWPCGIPEQTPGLMLGLAGIGHFYLRQADPDVPCILDP